MSERVAAPTILSPTRRPSSSTSSCSAGRVASSWIAQVQTPADHMRFLANHCWSDLVPVQAAVQRLLEPLQTDWATEALDNLAMMRGAASSD